MQRIAIVSGILLAAAAVIFGAFGAHALKAKLDAGQLQVFETAVRYQMYHAFALMLVGFSFDKLHASWAGLAGWFFLAGILLFSGSLYLLSCKNLAGIENWKFLGPVTPLGGLCLITGWCVFLASYLKK
jgi:uncharacterized membrane protein YgdD (TMEM256/DUF423 family)